MTRVLEYSRPERATGQWRAAVETAALAWPAAVLLVHLATPMAARLALGHWPRPHLDDPFDIHWAVSILCNLAILLHIVWPIGLFGGLFLWLSALASLKHPSSRPAGRLLFPAAWPSAWGLLWFLWLTDPGQWLIWLAD